MADSSYLDWPFFEDGHRELASRLNAWTADEIAPLEHEEPADGAALDAFAGKLVKMLGDAGWLRYCVPAAHGGALEHFDVRSLCLLREILARTAGLADFAFAMQGLGSGPITLFGTDEIKNAYLPRVADGTATAAFALSEPDAGSDAGGLTTSATKDGDDYVINGTKTWISNAGIADTYVVFARTGEAPGAKGLSAFVVEGDNPGLRLAERIRVMAPHPLGTIALEDCRVPGSHMLGKPGEGFKVAMATLDVFRTTVGAAALGLARRALDEGLERSRERQAFGQKLSEFQLIQQKIAEMALKVDAAALLVYRSAWTRDVKNVRVTRESSMAKLYATDAGQEVIDEAVQIWGGLGVVTGIPVERLYREIRALRIYEGTSEIQKLVIAAQTYKEAQ